MSYKLRYVAVGLPAVLMAALSRPKGPATRGERTHAGEACGVLPLRSGRTHAGEACGVLPLRSGPLEPPLLAG